MGKTIKKTGSKNWLIFLSAALLAGIILRLSFPGDIEYKEDEKFMFETSQKIGVTEAWPVVGMATGVGGRNPAMSIWIFAALARITHASTPPELARGVQLLNILGLLILALFSLRIVPEAERLPWLWATAFAAVNPFAVLFERKIWAQSTLPLFCVLFWIAWHYRKGRTGAFFWGLMGVFLGQIPMSGFFLAAGVFLWTAFREGWVRFGASPLAPAHPKHGPRLEGLGPGGQARWGFWVLGSMVGTLPLIPWLQYLLANPGNGFTRMNPLWILYPKYWLYWVTDSLGTGLVYALKTVHFFDFLRYPLVDGTGTYLVAVAHSFVIAMGIMILISAWRNRKGSGGWKDASETGLMVHSVLVVVGLLFTLSTFEIRRHYLIMSFPLEWVWLSGLALLEPKAGRKYLAVTWAAQLFISAMFLFYIHVNHGDPVGAYGVAYQFQGQ